MIIPPIGGTSGGISLAQAPGAESAPTGLAEGAQQLALGEGAQPGVSAPEGGESFGSELTEAIASLEKGQQSSDAASQALAAGTVKDPESAVATVEDAQLAMQLAAQIRTKATEAAQSIFQTQV